MPTQPFLRNPATGVTQQPQPDPQKGNPPKDQHINGNSMYNEGES